MSEHQSAAGDIRVQIRDCIHRLEHLLPGQAPIRDFVHHNTLHGLQHLPFPAAVAEARRITGHRGYLPAERWRAYLAEDRITRADLLAVIDQADTLEPPPPEAQDQGLQPERLVLDLGPDRPQVRRRDVYLALLCHPIGPSTAAQINWRINEERALTRFQPDLDPEARERLLAAAGTARHDSAESRIVADLWSACLEVLGLDPLALHPEELTELSADQATALVASITPGESGEGGDGTAALIDRQVGMEAAERLQAMLDQLGTETTLRELLRALTGEDLMEQIRPQVIRHLSNFLDEGFAPWRNPGAEDGLYRAWRATALGDLTPTFRDLPAWGVEIKSLPDSAIEAIVTLLKHLGLARERWVPYLERLALELPGWSGMVLWRHDHPGYGRSQSPVSMLDYLALRLALERIYTQRLCRAHWQIDPSIDMLRWYFRRHPHELFAREALYGGRLPEFLCASAAGVAATSDLTPEERDWRPVADLIWTWRKGLGGGASRGYRLQDHAWPLFRLAQHIGLTAADVARLGADGATELLGLMASLDAERAGYLWLNAFEHHYREQVLTALADNQGRGRWRDRAETPDAQVVLCMDDREEGLRRHLEELDPRLETLGAAAHYSVPHNWLGIDDREVTALAPVIPAPVIPAHEVRERPRAQSAALGRAHQRGQTWLAAWRNQMLQRGRLGLAGVAALSAVAGPVAGAALFARLISPAPFARLMGALRGLVVPPVPTSIDFVAPNDSPPASPEAPRLGYTDAEQAGQVRALLTSLGLTDGFAPLVAVLGHGSHNQNNPHASAYNCGACSGRFSGPNARLVSAMANRPAVRALLATGGIQIPADTWFVAAEHDTCNDGIRWYDIADLPGPDAAARFQRLASTLDQAARLHAQERARRFASARPGLAPGAALRHVANRAQDIAQVRPELGHATNACAFFGRRSMSRGVFLDRRAFLISYDPTRDRDGAILERHLVINGAVGAGISLEYYFSAANDEGYGSGSKVTHNVAGLLGVMDGAASDLRTGLPRQMIEIHEAMRLLVVVEQSTEILTAIYRRQPAVAELVGGAWIQLVAMDPDDGSISRFIPALGWVPWGATGDSPQAARVARSADAYLGHQGPRPPALVMAPDERPAHA